MNQDYLKGALLILAAGLCYAFQPIFARVAYTDGANAIALMLLRFTLAAIILHLYIYLRQKRRPQSVATARKRIFAMGMLVGLGAMCYFSALEQLSIGLVTLLFYMFPLYIFIFSAVLKLEAVSVLKLGAVMLAVGGVYISVDLDGSLPLTGVLLGLLAGVLYGVYIMLNNHFLARQDTLSAITWVSSGACLCFAVPSLAGLASFPQSISGYGAVAGLVIVSTLLSLTLFLAGTRLIAKSTDASVLAMAEIGTTLLLAWLLLNETISHQEILGAAVIFVAVLVILLSNRKPASPDPA